jgi:hypothetical protein
MIRAYCSRCNRDLDIISTPVCSRDMICRGCFWDLNREEIKEGFRKSKEENEKCVLQETLEQISS